MIKKYWDKFLLIVSAIGAIAFAVSRLFAARPSGGKDAEKLAEGMLQDEKKRLQNEKKQLVKEEKAVEKREYTDEEIERKYNK